jgi:hypothetical protein
VVLELRVLFPLPWRPALCRPIRERAHWAGTNTGGVPPSPDFIGAAIALGRTTTRAALDCRKRARVKARLAGDTRFSVDLDPAIILRRQAVRGTNLGAGWFCTVKTMHYPICQLGRGISPTLVRPNAQPVHVIRQASTVLTRNATGLTACAARKINGKI